MSIVSREEVYNVINEERKYQNSKWTGNTTSNENNPTHSLTEWLVYINDYSQEGLRAMTRTPDIECKPFALNTLRKIAALCVAAMEEHGVRTRKEEGARSMGART